MIKPSPIKMSEVRSSVDMGLQAAGEIVKADFALATGTWESENTPDWKEKKPHKKGTSRQWSYDTDETPFVWPPDYLRNAKTGDRLLTPGGTPLLIAG